MQLGEELVIVGLRRVVGLALGCLAIGGASLSIAPEALAQKTLKVSDSAHLHLTAGGGGNALNEVGKATGTLGGTVKVSLTIHQYTATSRFTIQTSRGSISGTGTGTLKTGKGGYASFGGAITVTGGTGAYEHASGKGGLYGTINRRDDAMTVSVSGNLRL
jgi:hypothetical protein